MSRSLLSALFCATMLGTALPGTSSLADETMEWLREEAFKGDAFYQRTYAIKLSHDYAQDGAVTEDEMFEVVRWLECAALQGYEPAIDDLQDIPVNFDISETGECHYTGAGYTADIIELDRKNDAPALTTEQTDTAASDTTSSVIPELAEKIYVAAFDAFEAENYVDALNLAKEAAAFDHAGAIHLIGIIYRDGLGVTADASEGAYHFRRAAELGDSYAMASLADCYLNGTGVEANGARALEWLTKASELGNTTAQFNLSWIYQAEDQPDIPTDLALARHWMGKAAENGDPDAPYYYGYFLEYGIGGAEEPIEAINWYQKAVELGDANGYAAMARMYSYGEYVTEDMERAWLYLLIAEDGDHPDAHIWRDTIEPYVTPDQRTRATADFERYRARIGN